MPHQATGFGACPIRLKICVRALLGRTVSVRALSG